MQKLSTGATTISGAESQELLGEKKVAVLFFHGYTGYPSELMPTAAGLHQQGYTVVLPRLVGHGTDPADFCLTTAEDWLCQAEQLYLDWQQRGYQVIPAGLSMGGAIACWLAAKQQSKALMMLAPALCLKDQRVFLASLLRKVVTKVPNRGNQYGTPTSSTATDQAAELLRQQIGTVYRSYHYLGPLAQLLRVAALARQALTQLQLPTFVALAGRDQTVNSAAVRRLLNRKLSDEQLWLHTLENARHVLTREQYQPQLLPVLLAWLAANTAPADGGKRTDAKVGSLRR